MKISNQIFAIKVGYILILLLALAYGFSDMQRGFNDGFNGVEPKENLSLISSLLLIAGAAIGLIIVINIYRFINSIQKAEVFSAVNIKRISNLGWCCILQCFLLYVFYYSKSDLSVGLNYQSMIAINFEFWLLIFGLTLLTISFVFKKGIELQKEQDLTI